jgi:phosphate starvation-inducible PhoH-like protein
LASLEFQLSPDDNKRLANLCGQFDEHLKQIEGRLGVELQNRGGEFRVSGADKVVRNARQVVQSLYEATSTETLTPEKIHLYLQESGLEEEVEAEGQTADIATRRVKIRCRGKNQIQYVRNIREYDLSFGVGPAGTGKTYLAVACAVEALEREKVRRLVLVRPAVEAGERLGFLPGDLTQKVDPYLRPIYDALYEFMGFERVAKLIERNVIEIAPLAYMRGRTLNHACVIMDEAQNTTVEQMKMFLTRIGFGSNAIVTGDVTQIDLPKHQLSGLKHVRGVLHGVEGIGFCDFQARDVVRHPLVQRIVGAYDAADKRERSDVAE